MKLFEGGLHNLSEAGGGFVRIKRKETPAASSRSPRPPNVVVELVSRESDTHSLIVVHHEVPVRHGVLVQPEPEHGGSRASQEARLRRLVVRHRIPR